MKNIKLKIITVITLLLANMQSMASVRIAIIFAMMKEARPFLHAEQMVQQKNVFDNKMPALLFRSKKNNSLWVIVAKCDKRFHVSSVGTQVAALITWETIHKLKPSIIISAGTAGGFKSHGANIADIYLSKDEVNYFSRRIPILAYQQYGEGHYGSYDTELMAKALGLKRGRVVTGDSLTMSPSDLDEINKLHGDVKDMESAAEAQVASYCNIDFMAVKSITDLIDVPQPSEQQFQKNFERSTTALTVSLKKIINFLVLKFTLRRA